MKGALNQRLQALLADAWTSGRLKQESLAHALDKDQRTISNYVNLKPVAGPLDLDEADAALRHLGSNLEEFLENAPLRDLTFQERMAQELLTRPDLAGLIEDLLPVPRPQLGDVLWLARALGRLASGKPITPSGEPQNETPEEPRTKSARAKRR